MGDAPEEEQNTAGTEHGRHGVDHLRHLSGIGNKKGEQFAQQHEEGGTGRMTNLKLVGCGDKFRAIPETCRRLYRRAVGESGNQKDEPTHKVVHNLVNSHLVFNMFNCFC